MNNFRVGRRGLATAVALVALLVAGGCGYSPGVVAYVGDARITQSELDRGVRGVQQTLGEGQQVAVGAVVNVLIQGRVAEQIARERGITVTDTDRDQVLKSSNLAPLLAVPDAKPVAFDAATQQIVAQRIGAEAYLKALAATTVTLNPRFGTLEPQQKTILDGSSGSLSQPANPQPTP